MVLRDEIDLLKEFRLRESRSSDGVGDLEIEVAEARLGFRLPESLKRLYVKLGGASDLLSLYNTLRPLEDVAIEDGFLVFMDENQFVVSWGFPLEACNEKDPCVWQRVNCSDPEWYSEELPILDFLASMFNWYREVGILPAAGNV